MSKCVEIGSAREKGVDGRAAVSPRVTRELLSQGEVISSVEDQWKMHMSGLLAVLGLLRH